MCEVFYRKYTVYNPKCDHDKFSSYLGEICHEEKTNNYQAVDIKCLDLGSLRKQHKSSYREGSKNKENIYEKEHCR